MIYISLSVVLKIIHSANDVVNVEYQILIASDHVQALPETNCVNGQGLEFHIEEDIQQVSPLRRLLA